jgi:hypothetical protein
LLDLIDKNGDNPLFLKNDDGEKLPIVVFSRVSPKRSSAFLLHIMLVMGEIGTEMDLKYASSMKESLAIAKLIPQEHLDDEERLKEYSNRLLRRIVDEIVPLQPIAMGAMQDFIMTAKQLLDSVLLHDTIPMTDLPPSILTELLNEKEKDMKNVWEEAKSLQVDAMMANLQGVEGLPTKKEILEASKFKPYEHWDPLTNIKKFSEQSEESFKEQKLALTMGVNAVNNYCQQFGPTTYTRGLLVNGAPGAGKTHVEEAIGLYGMSQGLRVMSSSLMAVRATALGGYHLHRLFQWEVGKRGNLFRLAEVSTYQSGLLSFPVDLSLSEELCVIQACS